MIPKVIHYCWFGGAALPPLAQKCIRSWRRRCPEYEIREWNESNCDILSAPLYVRQAFEAKKWAFVTDYIRLDVVYRYGGIYLDTDVEVIKTLDPFLDNRTYFGFEQGKYINTGLGFGAEKGAGILKELMKDYDRTPFLLPDGEYDYTPCPVRNTAVFLRHGLQQNDQEQFLQGGDIHIYPTAVFCPIDKYFRLKKTPKTVSIHWFSGSWENKEQKKEQNKYLKTIRKQRNIQIIKKAAKKYLGTQFYERVKKRIKK